MLTEVRQIILKVTVEESPVNAPGLPDNDVRAGAQLNFHRKNWAPAMRVAASAIGGGLVLYGLTAPTRWKKATAAVGIGLLTRGITNRELLSWADVGNPRKGD